MAEYLQSHKVAREIFCHYSPRLKRMIIIVLYTHEEISTFALTSQNASFCLPFWFILDHALSTPQAVYNAQLLLDSKLIRLLETPRSLREYNFVLTIIVISIGNLS